MGELLKRVSYTIPYHTIVVKKGELAAFYACCLNTRSPSGDKMKQSNGIFYAHHQEYSDPVCPNIKFAFNIFHSCLKTYRFSFVLFHVSSLNTAFDCNLGG